MLLKATKEITIEVNDKNHLLCDKNCPYLVKPQFYKGCFYYCVLSEWKALRLTDKKIRPIRTKTCRKLFGV